MDRRPFRERIGGALRALGRRVQFLVVRFFLFLLYLLGLGLTLLFVLPFARRVLRIKSGKEGTFWVDAEGYEPDPEACMRQT